MWLFLLMGIALSDKFDPAAYSLREYRPVGVFTTSLAVDEVDSILDRLTRVAGLRLYRTSDAQRGEMSLAYLATARSKRCLMVAETDVSGTQITLLALEGDSCEPGITTVFSEAKTRLEDAHG